MTEATSPSAKKSTRTKKTVAVASADNISSVVAQPSNLNETLEAFKRALEEATRQIKEIAVKVIEAGGGKTSTQEANKTG